MKNEKYSKACIVVGYHGIDTERLHSSAHPSLVVANT